MAPWPVWLDHPLPPRAKGQSEEERWTTPSQGAERGDTQTRTKKKGKLKSARRGAKVESWKEGQRGMDESAGPRPSGEGGGGWGKQRARSGLRRRWGCRWRGLKLSGGPARGRALTVGAPDRAFRGCGLGGLQRDAGVRLILAAPAALPRVDNCRRSSGNAPASPPLGLTCPGRGFQGDPTGHSPFQGHLLLRDQRGVMILTTKSFLLLAVLRVKGQQCPFNR